MKVRKNFQRLFTSSCHNKEYRLIRFGGFSEMARNFDESAERLRLQQLNAAATEAAAVTVDSFDAAVGVETSSVENAAMSANEGRKLFRFDAMSGDGASMKANMMEQEITGLQFVSSAEGLRVQSCPKPVLGIALQRALRQLRSVESNSTLDADGMHVEREQWQMVVDAITRYQNNVSVLDSTQQNIESDPNSVLDVSDSIKERTPLVYAQMVRDAARVDTGVLAQPELQRDMTSADFAVVVEEVTLGDTRTSADPRPEAVVHYPEDLKSESMRDRIQRRIDRKRVTLEARGVTGADLESALADDIALRDAAPTESGSGYRDLMREAASADASGTVLRAAIAEFDEHWSGSPDKETAYKALVAASIDGKPALVLDQFWRANDRVSFFVDVIDSLEPATRVSILSLLNAENANSFDDYEGGCIGFVKYTALSIGGDVQVDAIGAIVRNPDLFTYIQRQDNDLYQKIMDEVRNISDPEMRKLAGLETVLSDEENVADILKQITEAADPTAEIGRLRTLLENIPAERFLDSANADAVIAILGQKAELFSEMPDEWYSNKQMATKILRTNASAFPHISVALRNDPQVVYVALQSDEAGRGEMHWDDVGDQLKRRVESVLGRGVPTAQEFLNAIILNKAEDGPSSPDDVDTVLDTLRETMDPTSREFKEAAWKVLVEQNPNHPEFLLDAGETLRRSERFVRRLMAEDIQYFRYIDHNHFVANDPDTYKDLVSTAVGEDASLIAVVPNALRLNVDFLLSLAGDNWSTLAEMVEQFPPEDRVDDTFLTKLAGSELFKDRPDTLVLFLEQTLAEDLTYENFLNLLPAGLANRDDVVAAFLRAHPESAGENMAEANDTQRRNLDFIRQQLFGNPPNLAAFEGIDHAFLATNNAAEYRNIAIRVLKGNINQLQNVHESLQSNVSFLVEASDGNVNILRNIMYSIGPGIRGREAFVHSLMHALERNFGMKLEDVVEFVDRDVLREPNLKAKNTMEFWPEAIRRDREFVIGYLRENVGNPSCLEHVHEDIRNNKEDIRLILETISWDFFQYLDHTTLSSDADYYQNLVEKAYNVNPSYLKHAVVHVQTDPEFLWKLSGENEFAFRQLLLRISPVAFSQPNFLVRIMEARGGSPDGMVSFLRYLLSNIDAAYTGMDAIQNMLMKNNGEMLLLMMEKDSNFFWNRDFPAEALTEPLLDKMVDVVLRDSPGRVVYLLNHATPEVKGEYIRNNPGVVLSIFSDNPTNLVSFLGQEFLTMDTMQEVLQGYDVSQINRVINGVLAVKPHLVEGLLTAQPEMFDLLSEETQQAAVAVLGVDTINKVTERMNTIEASEKAQQRTAARNALAKSKAAAALVASITPQKVLKRVSIAVDGKQVKYDKLLASSASIDLGTAELKNIYSLCGQFDRISDALLKAMDLSALTPAVVNSLNAGSSNQESAAEFAIMNRLYRRTPINSPAETAVMDRFKSLLDEQYTAMNSATTDSDKFAKAQLLLSNTRAPLVRRFDTLDRAQAREYGEEAQAIMESISVSQPLLDPINKLPNNLERFYDLPREEHEFVLRLAPALGFDEVSVGEAFSKLVDDNRAQILSAYGEKVVDASTRLRLREISQHLAFQPDNPLIRVAAVEESLELIDIPAAPKILETLFTQTTARDVLNASVDMSQFLEVVRTMGRRFTPRSLSGDTAADRLVRVWNENFPDPAQQIEKK